MNIILLTFGAAKPPKYKNYMVPKTLGLIHTSATLIPVFQQLCQQHLPGVSLFNLVDDSLVKNIIARGGQLTPSIFKRVADYVASAEDAGADYIY